VLGVTRLEALALVDALLVAQNEFLQAADRTSSAAFLDALRRRDALRFDLVRLLAPEAPALRIEGLGPVQRVTRAGEAT
jgi:hypothetical protein